ncbi:MAG: geranylgeranylglyceryl/heptaprenylglyceryl phosphate synthase [Bacteroidetes bacterium HGW-Bacteroidetes-1]|jgi:putative glycerol-1-phosphate prenyltransferase|nr:MAG: geranylgeranylglyceryl/heptaprenylglyceryl phosphate synthase [Bacteroidetes bacterium HGW-Bacteroidetes-1]
MTIHEKFLQSGKKLAVLIDPDKPSDEEIVHIAQKSAEVGVDFFFVGGSLLTDNNLDHCIKLLKVSSSIPVVLFPGNSHQLSSNADGFLFLSLISGRNAEMLIGRHVIAAPYLRLSGLEVLSTGYMLIESGRPTTVSYMSNSFPIPADKNDIAMCTAMAGEMLGMKLIFMDAGSGAINNVPEMMVKAVKQSIGIPLIVGGGIRTPECASKLASAGADVIVIGNILEENPSLLQSIADAVHGSQ